MPGTKPRTGWRHRHHARGVRRVPTELPSPGPVLDGAAQHQLHVRQESVISSTIFDYLRSDPVAVVRADVIVHSLGGAIACVLAASHPELVRRMVLVDPVLDPVRPLPKVKHPPTPPSRSPTPSRSSDIGVYRDRGRVPRPRPGRDDGPRRSRVGRHGATGRAAGPIPHGDEHAARKYADPARAPGTPPGCTDAAVSGCERTRFRRRPAGRRRCRGGGDPRVRSQHMIDNANGFVVGAAAVALRD
ncbi:alpha/beta fold hydrolase [Micromonospora sp. KC606]|nr:alpha/beta fold hydrolase [Micromonospora sp. KC606]